MAQTVAQTFRTKHLQTGHFLLRDDLGLANDSLGLVALQPKPVGRARQPPSGIRQVLSVMKFVTQSEP
jgi:hypothetical protein